MQARLIALAPRKTTHSIASAWLGHTGATMKEACAQRALNRDAYTRAPASEPERTHRVPSGRRPTHGSAPLISELTVGTSRDTARSPVPPCVTSVGLDWRADGGSKSAASKARRRGTPARLGRNFSASCEDRSWTQSLLTVPGLLQQDGACPLSRESARAGRQALGNQESSLRRVLTRARVEP